jgi:hypothetical protein
VGGVCDAVEFGNVPTTAGVHCQGGNAIEFGILEKEVPPWRLLIFEKEVTPRSLVMPSSRSCLRETW